MKTLTVALAERSYPIHIGAGLLSEPEWLKAALRGTRAMVVSNARVAELYLPALLSSLAGIEVDTVLLTEGEAFKTLAELDRIFSALLERRHNRRTTLIALGGGVVGDMTGFAAACYQRGVDFIQVPTTLLAQVDSSVGGKTGVNHALGKNMIGAFHQPRAVVIDTDTLKSLPPRELSAGLAEVIKYGVIEDPAFFAWLEAHIDALRACEPEALAYAIERSCAIKARIVAADEKEEGIRAWLNLGHTFGHAIETGLGHGQWLHGEAVGCGMVLAGRLAQHLGWFRQDELERLSGLIVRAGLPVVPPPELAPERMLELMRVDKKNLGRAIRFVLPRAIGQVEITEAASDEQVLACLSSAFAN